MKGKKMGSVFLALLVFGFHLNIVNAVCDTSLEENLTKEANAVEVKYELIEKTTPEEYEEYKNPINDVVVITISNITENLQVHAKDGWGGEDDLYAGIDFTISYADTENGTYIHEISAGALRHVSFTITSLSDCGTKDEVIRELVIPGYNIYSLLDECQGSKAYYCQRYTDQFIEISKDEVKERASKEKKEETENIKKNENIFGEHQSVFRNVGLIIIVVAVAAIVILVIKKKGVK